MTYTFNKRRRSKKTSRKRKTSNSRRLGSRRLRSRRLRSNRRRRSKKTSRRRRSVKNDKVNFRFDLKNDKVIYEPLIIYTKEGCPACVRIKKICNEKGIKFKTFNRLDYEDKVNKNSNNYKYVPAIFDSRGKFIGGTPELEKLIS